MSVVVDASMTIAWLFDVERTAAVHAIMRRVVAEGAFVPTLLQLEVANVLRNAARRGRCDEAYIDRSLALTRAAEPPGDPERRGYGPPGMGRDADTVTRRAIDPVRRRLSGTRDTQARTAGVVRCGAIGGGQPTQGRSAVRLKLSNVVAAVTALLLVRPFFRASSSQGRPYLPKTSERHEGVDNGRISFRHSGRCYWLTQRGRHGHSPRHHLGAAIFICDTPTSLMSMDADGMAQEVRESSTKGSQIKKSSIYKDFLQIARRL